MIEMQSKDQQKILIEITSNKPEKHLSVTKIGITKDFLSLFAVIFGIKTEKRKSKKQKIKSAKKQLGFDRNCFRAKKKKKNTSEVSQKQLPKTQT